MRLTGQCLLDCKSNVQTKELIQSEQEEMDSHFVFQTAGLPDLEEKTSIGRDAH